MGYGGEMRLPAAAAQDDLNRFVRWGRLGVFNKIFSELASKAGKYGL